MTQFKPGLKSFEDMFKASEEREKEKVREATDKGVTSITGYTGGNGDVLTVTAPIDLMGESINITDVFTGYDNRCAANIYWLDDSGGKQSVAVPVVDRMVSVATGDLRFEDIIYIPLQVR